MKHKHAELIKAWADGAKIQILYTDDPQYWEDRENPTWHPVSIYRIKPEPKPDIVLYAIAENCKNDFSNVTFADKFLTSYCNLKLIFDGETCKLINAEVIK